MKDQDIVDLYWQRSEQAIPETETAYGPYCHRWHTTCFAARRTPRRA